MTTLLERIQRRRQPAAPPIPAPEPAIHSQGAMKFLALSDNFESARASRDRAHGQLIAATGQVANARRYLEVAAGSQAAVADQSRFVDHPPGRWAVTESADNVRVARRELDRAERAIPALRVELDAAEVALVEATSALAMELDHAADADRLVSLQVDLASEAVAVAQAVFQPALNRQIEARSRRRHPRNPDDLERALHDGSWVAEAEAAVEAADEVLQAARLRAREVCATREALERAVEAALAFEQGARRR